MTIQNESNSKRKRERKNRLNPNQIGGVTDAAKALHESIAFLGQNQSIEYGFDFYTRLVSYKESSDSGAFGMMCGDAVVAAEEIINLFKDASADFHLQVALAESIACALKNARLIVEAHKK